METLIDDTPTRHPVAETMTASTSWPKNSPRGTAGASGRAWRNMSTTCRRWPRRSARSVSVNRQRRGSRNRSFSGEDTSDGRVRNRSQFWPQSIRSRSRELPFRSAAVSGLGFCDIGRTVRISRWKDFIRDWARYGNSHPPTACPRCEAFNSKYDDKPLHRAAPHMFMKSNGSWRAPQPVVPPGRRFGSGAGRSRV
jgi:hypothetical protein